MSHSLQSFITLSDAQPLSLSAQAAAGPQLQPERGQVSLLIRHFLERFFNHETASPDGDAKARLILIALTTGLPGFMVAIYLWPVYHPFIGWPPGRALNASRPTYWLQVNHHFFFVLYSFVAMGIATVFEWDLFFPDLLDVCVLRVLPVKEAKVFLARAAAIAIFIGGFLFDANILALAVLPPAIDPPNLMRFLGGHLLAVAGSGLLASAFTLALLGVLLSVLGERLFRRVSLLLQGICIAALLIPLLLFPVFSGVVSVLLKTGSVYALCFPPFWFLGIYQRLMEGPAALPIYGRLAGIGCAALLLTAGLAIASYPLAYLRRTRELVEGPGTRDTRSWLGRPFNGLFHATVIRPPVRRAVFHFISQTLPRVARYRIYLVLYGGVGFSVVVATVLRFTVAHQQVRMEFSADGIRAAMGIVAFWMIAGMRMAFVSSGNQKGSWVFRIAHGKPAHFAAAIEQLSAAKVWVLLWAVPITVGACLASRAIAPPELLAWPATAAQMLVAGGMCLLLTDILFLHVTTVAFTGETPREQESLAFTLLKYFTFLPLVSWIPVAFEPWIEMSLRNFVVAVAVIAAAHLALRMRHRRVVREYCGLPGLEDDEEEFPMRLGLRY